MKRKDIVRLSIIILFFLFLILSVSVNYTSGKEIAKNFLSFSVSMLRVLPCAFILIGLFEVWVDRKIIEKHFGHKSGLRGYFWAIILAATTVGGLYVAFPVAHALHGKGAKLSVIFTYVGASAVCRIPMTVFEASFMGFTYSFIRLMVSIPLLIVTSMALGTYLEHRGYRISAPGKD